MEGEGEGETKDENMPAPLSMMAKPEDISDLQKLGTGTGTEIDNAIEQFLLTSKNFTEEFMSLSSQFQQGNKDIINDLELFKNDLLQNYSKMAEQDKKLSLKDKSLDSDSRFKTLTEKPTQLINNMTTLYTSLFEMVKSNMKIISHFLTLGKSLDKNKALQEFFSNEFNDIVNHWLFMKIDFDNFNVNEALAKSELDDNFKSFITKIYKKKSMKIVIEHSKGEVENEETKKRIKDEQKMISANAPNISKLVLKNAGDYSKIIEKNINFPKLKKFYFENGKIKESEWNFQNTMPELEKLSIKYSPNLEAYIIEKLPKKLKQLYLEKCNFVNIDFSTLLKLLNSNKDILNNLEVLSLAGNNITKVDFSILQQKTIYESLKELNFRKNKLYKFIHSPDNFPKLQFINFSKNSFNKSYLKDFGKLLGLESGNNFLFEPELCESYYNSLKQKICIKDDIPYLFDYLNITFIPKNLSMNYFKNFELNSQLMQKIKILDLSYNSLNNNTLFNFLEKNNNFISLHSLKLNGNDIDDLFFEKLMRINCFPKLEHLYLNSNRIGDPKVKVNYVDDIPIDKAFENDKILVYKLRLMYKFIEQTPYLTKLTITKNPIAEFYSVTKGKDSDKEGKYIKRDAYGQIVINCLFSMLVKIRDELLTNELIKEKRKGFNLKFDCRSNVNKNSENYPYGDRPIERKK